MPHYEDLTLDTPDGLKIKAYMILQGAGEGKEGMREQAVKRPTILFLHANAGNMVRCRATTPSRMVHPAREEAFFWAARSPLISFVSSLFPSFRFLRYTPQGHRLPFAHIFYEKLKCNVFMLSYRG